MMWYRTSPRGQGRRLSKRALARRALVAIPLCAVIAGLVAARPTGVDKGGPVVRHASVGETVRGDVLRVHVSRVRVGRGLHPAHGEVGGGATRVRDALLVVVDVTAASRTRSLYIHADLRTRDGSRYPATEAPAVDLLGSAMLYPGIPMRGAVAFELPADRLAGARLEVRPPDTGPLVEEVRVDLGIDEARAQRLVTGAAHTLALRDVRPA